MPRLKMKVEIEKLKLIMAMTLCLCLFPLQALAERTNKEQAIRAIIGEASNQGYHGMLAIAVGIRNRGTLKGVYGVRAKHVDEQPAWVWDRARKAWAESEDNRLHSGTHWENIKAYGVPYWVKSMNKVYEYKDHIFYMEKVR